MIKETYLFFIEWTETKEQDSERKAWGGGGEAAYFPVIVPLSTTNWTTILQ